MLKSYTYNIISAFAAIIIVVVIIISSSNGRCMSIETKNLNINDPLQKAGF